MVLCSDRTLSGLRIQHFTVKLQLVSRQIKMKIVGEIAKGWFILATHLFPLCRPTMLPFWKPRAEKLRQFPPYSLWYFVMKSSTRDTWQACMAEGRLARDSVPSQESTQIGGWKDGSSIHRSSLVPTKDRFAARITCNIMYRSSQRLVAGSSSGWNTLLLWHHWYTLMWSFCEWILGGFSGWFRILGQENVYSDGSEDDPFDKDEKARGRVRRGNEQRERTKDSATSTC